MSKRCSVTKIFNFAMAHQLVDSYSKECQNIHGHSYRLCVTLEGDINPDSGVIVDFKKIKEIVQPLVDLFDHTFLTAEIFGNIEGSMVDINPTAENMAKYFFQEIRKQTTLIKKVRLWETETCYVDYGY